MVQSCIKCGRNNQDEKDVTFFTVPSRVKHPEWHTKFLEQLCMDESGKVKKDLVICERHFNAEDIHIVEGLKMLKEDALPVPSEDEYEAVYVKSELVYLSTESGVSEISDEETQNLSPLEPLVECSYDEEQDSEYTIQENVKTELTEEDTEKGTLEVKMEPKIIENGSFLQPMMPFYLSDSSVFTILNENNEVGETIILQFENSDQQTDTEETEAKPYRDEAKIVEMERVLCRPKGSMTDTYSCDMCDYAYGCMNCLKSHYETMHVPNCSVAHYKCKYGGNYIKGLYCPVCELVFDCRNKTMDHYITHSVACDICFCGFDRQLYLTEHMMTVHFKNPEVIHECELCKAVYQFPAVLTRHYLAYHKMVLCYICKLRFESISQLQEHEKAHGQKLKVLPFACNKCDKGFPKISDIAVHIRQDHRNSNVWNEVKTLFNMADGEDEQMQRKKVKVKK